MSTISQALNQSVETLTSISDSPNLDAQILMAHVLEKSRAWIISHPEQELSPTQLSKFQTGISSLEQGKPLPYIIGKWEFYGLEFSITPDTLIPRPETELIVDLALQVLEIREGHTWLADIGTGSGCIAIALAKHTSNVSIFASDISISALKLARNNSILHDVNERIHFLQSDLLNTTSMKFDLICANLPYIPSKTLLQLKIYGHEPENALDGGIDGLKYISRLLELCPQFTKPGAVLLIEIDRSQAKQVYSLAERYFPAGEVTIHKDLAHNDRVVRIQLPQDEQ